MNCSRALPTRSLHTPRYLAPVVLQNKKVIYDLLFRASAETLLEVAYALRHLGAGSYVLREA
jgi:hypothetical protein